MPQAITARTPSALTLLATLAGASAALAGPLEPPAGPITSTFKTLSEVAPRVAVNATNTPGDANSVFRIDAPGSYYLTADLVGISGDHGLVIASDSVTLDLNGFTMAGVTGALDAINVSGARKGLTIRNGLLRDWPGDGIDASDDLVHVDAVSSIGNAGFGIRVGNASFVNGCTAESNGLDGIFVNTGSITRCVSRLNGGDGFAAGTGSLVTDCASRDNGAFGYDLSTGSKIQNCTSRSDDGGGIDVSTAGTILDCSVTAAGVSGGTAIFGINGGFNTTISRCMVNGRSGTGIRVAGGGVIESCAANSNGADGILCGNTEMIVRGCTTNNNGGDGIVLHRKSMAVDCISNRNTVGIRGRVQSTVRGCTVSECDSDGIVFAPAGGNLEAGTVIDCTITECGGEGIQLLGAATSHVSGCMVADCAGRGIQSGGVIANCTVLRSGTVGIFASGAMITNCSSSSNTQYGFDVNDSTIQGCSANCNTLDGIYCRLGNLVMNNNCKQNSGSGIRVFSSGNRLEGNHAYFNGDYGIEVTSTSSNMLMRNTASSNTTGNYLTQTQTDYGTITTVSGSFSTSNSFANLQY